MLKSLSKVSAGVFVAVAMLAGVAAFGPANSGVFGAQKAIAADPHGDWWTQYQITTREAVKRCGAAGSNAYVTSHVYGSNSRYFKYTCPVGSIVFYIGNSYYIWDSYRI